MLISVRVTASAKKDLIKEDEFGNLKAYLCAPAVDGKANKALVKILAAHFHVKKSAVEIKKGLKSRNKTVSIAFTNC